jgi:uncharacterized Tic20 family protein
MKNVLLYVVKIVIFMAIIALITGAASFMIGVVRGAVFGFIDFPIYLKWAEKVFEWALGITIYVFLIWALIKSLFNKSTYNGIWSFIKKLWCSIPPRISC